MDKNIKDKNQNQNKEKNNKKPEYIPPKITTYTEEDILEQIGPAHTCTGSPCVPA